jgi:uncharacterized protein
MKKNIKRVLKTTVLIVCAHISYVMALTPESNNQNQLSSINTYVNTPTEESIKQLLELTQANKAMQAGVKQGEEMLIKAFSQMPSATNIDPKYKGFLEKFQSKIMLMIREDYKWENEEKSIINLYRDIFSQDEISSMIDFYKTAGGQAITKKMPLLTEKIVRQSQEKSAALIQKIKTIEAEIQKEVAVEVAKNNNQSVNQKTKSNKK